MCELTKTDADCNITRPLWQFTETYLPWASQSVSDILALNLLNAKRESFLDLLSQWHRILSQSSMEKWVFLDYCAEWYDNLTSEDSPYNLVYTGVHTEIDDSYRELLKTITSFYTGVFMAAHQSALKMDASVPFSFPDTCFKDESFIQLKATIARLHMQFMEG